MAMHTSDDLKIHFPALTMIVVKMKSYEILSMSIIETGITRKVACLFWISLFIEDPVQSQIGALSIRAFGITENFLVRGRKLHGCL